MTVEEWAPYGVGAQDEDGLFEDYNLPPELREAPPAAPATSAKPSEIDDSLLAIVKNWRLVVADLAKEYGVDLYDPAVRSRPWAGVRTMIFGLIDADTRLRRALTRR